MKNKKIIRLFTAALAVALCATAFAVPAFAGGGEGEPYYTETAGTEADPAEDAEAPEVTITDEEDPAGDDSADNNTEADGDTLDQITELLTDYGPIYQIWMDHWSEKKNCPAVTAAIRKLQPECILTGPDVRSPGNEKGTVVYPSWNPVYTMDSTNNSRAAERVDEPEGPNEYGLLETYKIVGHPNGQFWRSLEAPTADMFNHGGWFWHGPQLPMPMDDRIENYYRSVGLGANLIINLPSDRQGLIPAETVADAKAWGDTIRKLFYGPFIAETETAQPGSEVELTWEKPCRIDHVMLMENIANGQKVANYTLEAFVDGKWQAVVPANRFKYCPEGYNASPGFETIGHKKIDRIVPVVTDKLRFRCTKAAAEPVEIAKFAVWNVGEANPSQTANR